MAVGDHHVIEHQVRIQSLPARFQTTDRDRLANRPAGRQFDFAAVFADFRQHAEAQDEQQDHKQQPGDEQTPTPTTQAATDPRPGEDRP